MKHESTLTRDMILDELYYTAGVGAALAMEKGLIELKYAKKYLVRVHYFRLAKNGYTYNEIKSMLGKKYGMSFSQIEKLIYGKDFIAINTRIKAFDQYNAQRI